MAEQSHRVIVEQVKDFLDSKGAAYIHTEYSKSYPPEKIQHEISEFGAEHVEVLLIKMTKSDNTIEFAMVIVPAIRKIHLESLRRLLNIHCVSLIDNQLDDFDLSKNHQMNSVTDYHTGTLPPFVEFYSDMQIYLSDEVLQLQEIVIYIQNYENSIRMTRDNFLLAVQPVKIINIPTTPKYKISVAQVFPKVKRDFLHNHKHCILGLSPKNYNSCPVKLVGMAEWISERFSECCLFIGDSIHRFTLEIDGFPVQGTSNRALKIGRDVIDRDAAIFEAYQEKCKFSFVLCSELQKEPEYQEYYQSLYHLFETNEDFKHSVRMFADMFVRNLLI